MLISFSKLKKIAVIAVSVVAIAFTLTHNPLSTTVQAAGTSGSSCTTEGDVPKLHTDGRWFKDEADNLVTLRGISFCGFNNEWGEKVLPDFKSKIAKVTNGTNGWYPKCDSFLIARPELVVLNGEPTLLEVFTLYPHIKQLNYKLGSVPSK